MLQQVSYKANISPVADSFFDASYTANITPVTDSFWLFIGSKNLKQKSLTLVIRKKKAIFDSNKAGKKRKYEVFNEFKTSSFPSAV